MNLSAVITDNITEILVKIMQFTQRRQKVLTQNINGVHSLGFVPKDLPVDEFSELLSSAVDEHIRKQRLILRDTEHIRFGTNGSFEVRPIVDTTAEKILADSRDRYLALQINKLLENSLNHRIAAQLLMQKRREESIFW